MTKDAVTREDIIEKIESGIGYFIMDEVETIVKEYMSSSKRYAEAFVQKNPGTRILTAEEMLARYEEPMEETGGDDQEPVDDCTCDCEFKCSECTFEEEDVTEEKHKGFFARIFSKIFK